MIRKQVRNYWKPTLCIAGTVFLSLFQTTAMFAAEPSSGHAVSLLEGSFFKADAPYSNGSGYDGHCLADKSLLTSFICSADNIPPGNIPSVEITLGTQAKLSEIYLAANGSLQMNPQLNPSLVRIEAKSDTHSQYGIIAEWDNTGLNDETTLSINETPVQFIRISLPNAFESGQSTARLSEIDLRGIPTALVPLSSSANPENASREISICLKSQGFAELEVVYSASQAVKTQINLNGKPASQAVGLPIHNRLKHAPI